MRVELAALQQQLPILRDLEVKELCERLAALGFPVDAVEAFETTTVLEVDITANRGDAMSHRGLARDLGARLGADLAPVSYLPVLEAREAYRPIRLEAEACPIYASAVLELGAAQFTPTEVQSFLRAMGSTPKNLASVDASNELLHRFGQPTHAFDADLLEGPITVRWAAAGEKLVTLDGIERTLDGRDLVIADASGPIALAGVMGGDSTKVTEATRRVLLESAWFDPKVVRLMARRHNLHTDASHRFGRGADPAMARVGRDLLLRRIEAWAGAKVLGVWSVGAAPAERPQLELQKQALARIAGEPVSLAESSRSLQRLGCRVASEPGRLHVVPPSWRQDLGIAEDLAEEVLRMRGYERIPVALPPLEGPPRPLSAGYRQAKAVALRLAHLGFQQTVTFGFVSPEEDAEFAATPAPGRTLSNPLGREYSVMRGSLLPSMRSVARANLRQGAPLVRIFELAPSYASAAEGRWKPPPLRWCWAGPWAGWIRTPPPGRSPPPTCGAWPRTWARPERTCGSRTSAMDCSPSNFPWTGCPCRPSGSSRASRLSAGSRRPNGTSRCWWTWTSPTGDCWRPSPAGSHRPLPGPSRTSAASMCSAARPCRRAARPGCCGSASSTPNGP